MGKNQREMVNTGRKWHGPQRSTATVPGLPVTGELASAGESREESAVSTNAGY